MSEIVFIARRSWDHPDPEKQARQWAVGHFVEILPDGSRAVELANPNSKIKLPRFGWLLFPGVPKSVIEKYLVPHETEDGVDELGQPRISMVARRIWRLRYADLPLAARNKFIANGGALTIKVAAYYSGPSDYAWSTVRTYLRNTVTGLDEIGEL